MHHVADARHIAKRARAELAVQACGVLVGIDNAIVRAGNQADRNIQLLVKLAESPGGVRQHLCFFFDGSDLRRAQSMRDRVVPLEPLGNRARREHAPYGIGRHQVPAQKQGGVTEQVVHDGKPR